MSMVQASFEPEKIPLFMADRSRLPPPHGLMAFISLSATLCDTSVVKILAFCREHPL